MELTQEIFVELQNQAHIEAINNPGSDEGVILEQLIADYEEPEDTREPDSFYPLCFY